ncbi:MAG: 16S rRNA (uracil(1498)-N(3))-methyltransferase [Planctomycetes bacterium]|nr:16S rRNA (uracil(1498)-N(3))-methyltransferase [Planctomycetota bacterium]
MIPLFIGLYAKDNHIYFSPNESRHISVKRIKPDTLFHVRINNELFLCKLDPEQSSCALIINKLQEPDTTQTDITLASPLPKGKRKAFMIEKLTEIGITRFLPLDSNRSITKPSENSFKRLCKISLEASKQSHGNPIEIQNTINLIELCSLTGYKTKIVFDKYAIDTIFTLNLNNADKILGVIGPEGGFTTVETELLNDNGFQSMAFNTNILRIETSCIYAAVMLKEIISYKTQ